MAICGMASGEMALVMAMAFICRIKVRLRLEFGKVTQNSRTIGWTLLIFSILMIIGALVIAAWDGIRSGFTFWQFFIRFLILFTVYKVYDMVFFDYFWLLKFRFFQYYYPEAGDVMEGKKYGFNIKSQLLKLLVIFPAVSALAAWICTLF